MKTITAILLISLAIYSCAPSSCIHLPSEGVRVQLSDSVVTVNDKSFVVDKAIYRRNYEEYYTSDLIFNKRKDIIRSYSYDGILICTIIKSNK